MNSFYICQLINSDPLCVVFLPITLESSVNPAENLNYNWKNESLCLLMRSVTKLWGLHLPGAPKGADQTGLMGVECVYRSVTLLPRGHETVQMLRGG